MQEHQSKMGILGRHCGLEWCLFQLYLAFVGSSKSAHVSNKSQVTYAEQARMIMLET